MERCSGDVPPTSRASTGMSSSSVAEPSNSVHLVVRIVERAAGTRGLESTKITAELSPQDLFSAFAKLGSLLVGCQQGLPTPHSVSWLHFSSCAFRCFPGF